MYHRGTAIQLRHSSVSADLSAVNRRVASSNLARGANLLLNFQTLTTTSIS